MQCKKCEKEMTHVIEWNTTSMGYNLNIETMEYDGAERYDDNMQFENYACPFCGANLTTEQSEKIMQKIVA